MASENSSHKCFSLKNMDVEPCWNSINGTSSKWGHDFLLSWLWMNPCFWFPKYFHFIWAASPVFFIHCIKSLKSQTYTIAFITFSISLWNTSANIKVCLETKYFNVILSGPSYLLTARARAVKRVQYLFWLPQLSSQKSQIECVSKWW